MWKLFGYGEAAQGDSKAQGQGPEDNLIHLKQQIQARLEELQRLYQHSEARFQHHYLNQEPQELLATTFQQLIATIEGLIIMVSQLRSEYERFKDQLQEHHQLKHMVSNHQDIVSAIQDSHSQQVAAIYQAKNHLQHTLKQQIQNLKLATQRIAQELEVSQRQLFEKRNENAQLQTRVEGLEMEAESLRRRTTEAEVKYEALTKQQDPNETRKIVDLEHIKLDYLFYYGKIRQRLVAYLDVKDLVRLQQTSKFYYLSIKRRQARDFYLCLKKQYENRLTREIRDAKHYEKIYELFPSENIKINALKYLYFKIKPATYILPYLQEQPIDAPKHDQQPKEKTKGSPKFSWKSLFNSERALKSEKKEESKFTLSSLKSEEDFQRIEAKIESLFKNILQMKLPEDLQYFSESMESQLQELKAELGHNKGKGTQMEWTAQIFCLARYMYHEINQMYNLLQVIFGELILKNKELLSLRESYDYMTENELVLRNLIENVSSDKASLEKKLIVIENDILKSKLEGQAISNSCDRVHAQNASLKKQLQALQAEHLECRHTIAKYEEQQRKMDQRIAGIRQEIDNIENMSGRVRKNSMGSISSEGQGGQEVTG